MTAVLSILFLVSLILLVLGLFSPKVSLFFLKGEKKRGKSALIYSVTTILFFVLFGIVNTVNKKDSSNNQIKEVEIEETTESINYADNRNVKKWVEALKNVKDLEDLIEKKIQNNWSLNYQITYNTIINYSDSIQKPFLEFKNPLIGFPKFKDSNNDGSYRIDGNILTFIVKGGASDGFGVDEQKWEVYYSSSNLLCLTNGDIYNVYSNSSKDEKAKEELSYFLAFEKIRILLLFKSVIESGSNELSVEKDLIKYLAVSDFYNQIQKNLISDEMISKINEYLVSNSAFSDSILSVQFVDIFQDYPIPTGKYKVNPNYIQKFEDVALEWSWILYDRKNRNLETKKLATTMAAESKKYQKMNKEYELYGTGSEFDMTWVAKSFIQEGLKNPDSFQFVDGFVTNIKTKTGWVYQITYRGTNSYGAIVTEKKNLILAYSSPNRRYFVVGEY